jgi:hypothetical protein
VTLLQYAFDNGLVNIKNTSEEKNNPSKLKLQRHQQNQTSSNQELAPPTKHLMGNLME